jgi:uncharacterized lipoprotein YehR (DUF1307 family)
MVPTFKSFQWRKVQILSATFFCITLALTACKKKETMVGKDAFDANGLLNSIETEVPLKTYTIEEDSVVSKNQLHALLGAYNDPKFGTVDASFYTQISLDNPGSTSFGVNPMVDSIVLSLQYTGYYGENKAQTFEVYELADELSAISDSIYYSFTTKNVNPTNLVFPGKETITPQPSIKSVVGTDTLAAQLRIPLKNSLATYLMDGVALGKYVTQDLFHEYFKGIYVKVSDPNPPSGQGAVYYFSLSAINSKLTIYYKNDAIAKTFSFLMNGTSVDFNHLNFNRTGKPIDNLINNPELGKAEYYAQAFTSRAVIEMNGINDIPKNSIIHKAQLIVPITHYTNNLLYPSVQLNVGTRITADNDTIYSIGNVIYDDNQKAFVIDLRQHVQQVVSQIIVNRGVFLRPTYFNSTVERIIFNGTESVNKKKPKLVVTYTNY